MKTEKQNKSDKQQATKKRYESPQLVEWGSVEELTNGPGTGNADGDWTGSGGTF